VTIETSRWPREPCSAGFAFYTSALLARFAVDAGRRGAGAINGLFESGASPILGFRAVEGRSAQPRDAGLR